MWEVIDNLYNPLTFTYRDYDTLLKSQKELLFNSFMQNNHLHDSINYDKCDYLVKNREDGMISDNIFVYCTKDKIIFTMEGK